MAAYGIGWLTGLSAGDRAEGVYDVWSTEEDNGQFASDTVVSS
jgi:hypothetical protein